MVDAAAAPAFVGRAVELERLEATFARVISGTPAIVLVGGEAGIGKTRLVEEFARGARAVGARVLRGACLRIGDGGLPFAPFVAALRELVRGVPPGDLAALLGPGRGRLTRLVPELDGPAGSDAHGLESRRRGRSQLFEAVLDALERVARQGPLVLVIEDLQWADRSSLDLLTYLARVIREGPILIVATVRSDEVRDRQPLLTHLAELERLDDVERIELGPFARRDVGALVERTVGGAPDDELIDALMERTDGNPFFIDQLLHARREAAQAGGPDADGAEPDDPSTLDLPPRLRDVLLSRVAGLSAPAREVLRAAAAAGHLVDDDLLAAVVERPAREIRDALREAVERRILVAVVDPDQRDPDAVAHAFRHELIREVVLGELFAGERQRLHAGFATALSARVADGAAPGADPPEAAELAYHWDAAHDWPRALRATVEAGHAAEHAYAFAEALRHDERALELWDRIGDADRLVLGDRATLLERTAEMASLVGEHRRSVELGRAAVAAIPAGADVTRRALYLERLRWFLWEAGDRLAAEAALSEAARLTPDGPATPARARLHAHRAALDMAAGQYATSRSAAETALSEARATGAHVEEALALGVLGFDVAMLGDVDAGIAHLAEARAIAAAVDNVEGVALGWSTLATLEERVGRAEEAVLSARSGVADAAKLGVLRTYGGRLRATEAAALYALGRWDEAERAVAAGLDARPTGRAEIAMLAAAARLDTGSGRFAQAARRLDAARAADDARGGSDATGPRSWPRSPSSACGAGLRPTSTRRPTRASGSPTAIRPIRRSASFSRSRSAATPMEPRERAPIVTGRARQRPSRRLPSAWRPSRRGRAPARRRRRGWRRGSPVPWRSPPPNSRAAVTGEGRTPGGSSPRPSTRRPARSRRPMPASVRLRPASPPGSRTDAAEALRRAHATAVRVGATPLASEIATLARLARIELDVAAAAPDGHPALAGLGLTEREAEVLRLVAGGWTNQQIADALFIARKTASVHVSNILGKLGVGSRVEAAAIAHRLGFGAGAPPPPDAD